MNVDLTLPLDGRQIGDRELMARLDMKRSAFYALKAEGKFDFLLARPQVLKGSSRYCGALVKLYVDGTKPQRQASEPAITHRLVGVAGGRGR